MEIPRTVAITAALTLGILQLVNAEEIKSATLTSSLPASPTSTPSPFQPTTTPTSPLEPDPTIAENIGCSSPIESTDDLPWRPIAIILGGTTALFLLATCTLLLCLCIVVCQRHRQDSKGMTFAHQASFSAPISNQVYVEDEKGSGGITDVPGSTNTFVPTSTTISQPLTHSPQLTRKSTNSSIASGGYVEMRGGLDDQIAPPSCPVVSPLSVSVTTTPARHTTQGLQHRSLVSSTLPVSPQLPSNVAHSTLDYENATAWLLADKIKEHDRIKDRQDPSPAITRPKPVARARGNEPSNGCKLSSELSFPNYPGYEEDPDYQVPQLPPKPYKEIDFLTIEPASEYMKPNEPVSSFSSLPRAREAEFSFNTYSKSNTLGHL